MVIPFCGCAKADPYTPVGAGMYSAEGAVGVRFSAPSGTSAAMCQPCNQLKIMIEQLCKN
ncbi:MAG TPA: hypothetical protein VKU38_19580 [Ktedonobacteraceae bacterium]|nr:hypothetical protein [Ktedonobacteraceae bacterium]